MPNGVPEGLRVRLDGHDLQISRLAHPPEWRIQELCGGPIGGPRALIELRDDGRLHQASAAVHGHRIVRCPARALQVRDEDGRQNPDDQDDHQQLDQGKALRPNLAHHHSIARVGGAPWLQPRCHSKSLVPFGDQVRKQMTSEFIETSPSPVPPLLSPEESKWCTWMP